MRSTIPALLFALLLMSAGCGDDDGPSEDSDPNVDEQPTEDAPEGDEDAAIPWLLPADDLADGPDEYAFAYEEAFYYPDEDGGPLEFSNKAELWDEIIDEVRDDVLSYGDTDPGEVWFVDGDPDEIAPLPYLTFLLYSLIQPGYYGGLLDTTVETDAGDALTLSYPLIVTVDDGHGELVTVGDPLEFPTEETEQEAWFTESVETLEAFGFDELDDRGYFDEPGDVDGALE